MSSLLLGQIVSFSYDPGLLLYATGDREKVCSSVLKHNHAMYVYVQSCYFMSLPAVERLTDDAGFHLSEILSVLGLAFARVIALP